MYKTLDIVKKKKKEMLDTFRKYGIMHDEEYRRKRLIINIHNIGIFYPLNK